MKGRKDRSIGGEFKLSYCGVDRTGLFKDCFGGEERVNRTKDILNMELPGRRKEEEKIHQYNEGGHVERWCDRRGYWG